MGVASRNSSQTAVRCPIQSRTGMPTISPMVRINSGTAAATLTQSRG
jgi:hypothetical protein